MSSETAEFDAAVLDRAIGTLLGLAVGDALGTTLEFEERDQHPLHTEMTGGGPFDLMPGQWTDDTAMALALATSLLEQGQFDAQDLATRFVEWWRTGAYSCTGTCFDIGVTTARALARLERGGNSFAGSTAENESGNGSLMRVAPVALFGLDDARLADRIARDQSRITHAATQPVEACVFFIQILREAILGNADPLRPRGWQGHPAIMNIATGAYRTKTRKEIRSSGYVAHTLEAALWAVHNTCSFEDALILAVNLGGDADTIGAVTGQLAGALYGASAVPKRWLKPVAWRDQITSTAVRLTLRLNDAISTWQALRAADAFPAQQHLADRLGKLGLLKTE